MNTLEDLRGTLAGHADDVEDLHVVDRAGAVRHRVVVVRRRRRAAVAGAAAVVVAAATVGLAHLGPDSRPTPAAPTVLGVRAPETLRSLGYTYRAEPEASAYDGSGRLRLPASDTPRLVSWVADRAATVRVKVPGEGAWTSREVAFGDFTWVAPGDATTLAVSVDRGRVGLVTYDLTDTAPAGYTKDGITFRDHVAQNTLQAAAIGDVGQNELTVTFPMPDARVAAALSCTGLPRHMMVEIEAPRDGGFGTSCGHPSDPIFDPGAYPNFPDVHGLGAKVGEPVTLRVHVTGLGRHGRDVPASELPDLRIALGVYAMGPSTRVAGWDVPDQVEYDGHLWDAVGHAETGGTTRVRADGTGAHLASIPFTIGRTSGFRVTLDGRAASETAQSATGQGMFGPQLVGQGRHTVSVRATHPSPGDRIGLVVYDRAD